MPTETLPLTDKRLAADLLERMPETATLEEISERLAILAGIRRGERDADAGRLVSHEKAERRSRGWMLLGTTLG